MARRDLNLWKEIKADYLATGKNYAALAERYGVSLSAVKRVAAKERWTLERDNIDEAVLQYFEEEQVESEPETEPGSVEEPNQSEPVRFDDYIPTADDIIEEKRTRMQKFMSITDMMMDRIEDALMDPDVRSPYALKYLASALRDLREMQGLNRSALDIEEQKARIAKLKSETARYEVTEAEEAGGIIFLPMTEGKLVPPDE